MKKLPTKTKGYAHKFLRRLGYRACRIGPYSVFDFESFLYRHLAVHKSLTFLQIGANDGMMSIDGGIKKACKMQDFNFAISMPGYVKIP